METMRRVRNPPLLTAAMITVLFEDPPSELLGGPGEELGTPSELLGGPGEELGTVIL